MHFGLSWLLLPLLLPAAYLWLWKSTPFSAAVPNLFLFRRLLGVSGATAAPRRRLDKRALCFWLAALLAILAAAGPSLRPQALPARLITNISSGELYLRAEGLPADSLWLLRLDGRASSHTSASLRQGLILGVPGDQSLKVELSGPGGRLEGKLVPPSRPKARSPVWRTAAPEPLRRVVEALSAPATSDRRGLWLGGLGSPLPGDLVIHLGRPDQNSRTATPVSRRQNPLLSAVDFQGVQVRRIQAMSLPSDAEILAQVDELPWLAWRHGTFDELWIASGVGLEASNWALEPSFVIFFTNLLGVPKEAPWRWEQETLPPVELRVWLLLGALAMAAVGWRPKFVTAKK